MNKYIYAVAVSSLMNISIAHAQWYVGANIGANAVVIDKTLNYPLHTDAPVSNANYSAGYNNMHVQFVGGKSLAYNQKFGASVEGVVDWFTGITRYTIDNYFITNGASASERLKQGYGIYFLPEYYYSKATKLFVGPGYACNKFTMETGTTSGNLGVSENFNAWVDAWSIKAGVASHINEQNEVVISYQFNQYKGVGRTHIEPLSQELLTARYRPQANLFMLGWRVTV